jgi:hypothetical protein
MTLEDLFKNSMPIPFSGCWVFEGGSVVSPRHYRYAELNILAHRLALELSGYPLLAEQEVHHTCHVPDCINPDHLVALSHEEHGLAHRKAVCGKGHAFSTHGYYHKNRRYCRRCRTEYAYKWRHRYDDYVDGAGYAGCAGEVAESLNSKET